MGVLLGKNLALSVKSLVEGATAIGVETPGKSFLSVLSGYLAPVELTGSWDNETGKGWKAKMKRLYFDSETGTYRLNDQNQNESDIFYPLSNDKPPGDAGTRAFAVYRGRWEVIAFGEFGVTHAKELFPAVKYIREPNKTYIICPGGRGTEHSIKTVHVLHVEERKISTSTFGSLPMAMSNFDAALADNSYGNPVLVCAPGEVESGTKYPVQRYDFTQEEWTKTDTEYSLTGCPAL